MPEPHPSLPPARATWRDNCVRWYDDGDDAVVPQPQFAHHTLEVESSRASRS